MVNTLHNNMSTQNLNCMNTINTLYHEFFIRKDYEWWYEIQPGDIVVDVGANIGMFTCLALDKGAKKVYAIEPNLELLKTTMYNATPQLVDNKENRLTPINCAISSREDLVRYVHGDMSNQKLKIKSFKSILEEYNIDKIDFLKIDCEGGEYDILNAENLDFIKKNVKHIAVEVHLDFHKEGPARYVEFKDNFLSHFDNIKFLSPRCAELTYKPNRLQDPWPIGWDSCWMIYICNHSI